MKEILIWVKDRDKENFNYRMLYLKDYLLIIKWLMVNINFQMVVDIKDKYKELKCKEEGNFGFLMVLIMLVILIHYIG